MIFFPEYLEIGCVADFFTGIVPTNVIIVIYYLDACRIGHVLHLYDSAVPELDEVIPGLCPAPMEQQAP